MPSSCVTALRRSVLGSLYRPSSLESRTGTRRKRLSALLLSPLQLSNERLLHEARPVNPGEKKTTACAFSIRPGATETSPAPSYPSRAPPVSVRLVFVRTAALRGFARFCGNWLRRSLLEDRMRPHLSRSANCSPVSWSWRMTSNSRRLEGPSNTYPSGGYDEYQAQVCV
jgi:hypothetical protein